MTTPEPEDDPDFGSTPAGEHPTLFQLRSGQCRFPLGAFAEPVRFFCGAPARPGKPYCAECCGRAYVVSQTGVKLWKQGAQP